MNPYPCGPQANVPVIINIPGAPGAQGAVGATGPAGPAGSAGPAGASASTVVYSVYGNSVGTKYALASNSAGTSLQLLAMTPTAPSVVLVQPGSYLLLARARIDMAGITMANATTALTFQLFCANNTIAAVPNTTRAFVIPQISSTQLGTGTLTEFVIPPVVYTASAGDNIQMWGSCSGATNSSNSFIYAVEADLIAIQLPMSGAVFQQYSFSGSGSPQGSVSALVGSTYVDVSTGNFWVKQTGAGTSTGWLELITA